MGYDLKDITLVPRPLHRPVDVWQPIASRRTLRYIAQIGIKGVVHGTGEKLADEVIHEYQDAAAEVGRELALGEDLALGLFFYIDGSQEKAMERARLFHDERYKWFAPFGLVRYTDVEGRPWGTPGAPSRVPTLEDGVDQKVWLCGALRLRGKRSEGVRGSRYPGLEHVILHWPEGMPLAEYSEQLTRFHEEVMPKFGEGG